MNHNSINTLQEYNNVMCIINNDNTQTIWDSKPFKNCLDTYSIDFIGETLQSKILSGKHSLEIINYIVEFMLYPLLNGDVTFNEYKKCTDEFNEDVIKSSSIDDIYSSGINKLIKLGYC